MYCVQQIRTVDCPYVSIFVVYSVPANDQSVNVFAYSAHFHLIAGRVLCAVAQRNNLTYCTMYAVCVGSAHIRAT